MKINGKEIKEIKIVGFGEKILNGEHIFGTKGDYCYPVRKILIVLMSEDVLEIDSDDSGLLAVFNGQYGCKMPDKLKQLLTKE